MGEPVRLLAEEEGEMPAFPVDGAACPQQSDVALARGKVGGPGVDRLGFVLGFSVRVREVSEGVGEDLVPDLWRQDAEER